MFVVMNRLRVEDAYRPRLEEAFRHSGERMKQVPGCLRFLLLNEKESNLYIVYTEWQDEQAYQAWINSPHFQQAHAQSQGPSQTQSELETFEVLFASVV
ncbi:MAG: antibiotic biosynthesis monooxygenase [Firmicutes bacterium]|nr:antibiotic biosynthesis monooxygenase [Bacillota bacterium]